jgi:succinyl-CoA synthetase beta subunit
LDLLEHEGKAILSAAGIAVPRARLCATPAEAASAAAAFGRVAIKAQIPAGRRGKAGGVRFAAGPAAAARTAAALLGEELLGHKVDRVLVEEQLDIARELYVAVTVDPTSKGPLLLLSLDGGVEVEAAFCGARPSSCRLAVDILDGLSEPAARRLVADLGLPDVAAVVQALLALYGVWRDSGADLVEINPLAILPNGALVALDCKITVDEAARYRHPEWPAGRTERLGELELRGRAQGLDYIALGGSVGVLANGAGLTMATVDVIAHFGGKAANFLEIGGDAYTKAEAALGLVLASPGLKSLVVNFCGAYARTDVMVGGVIDAWEKLAPDIPVFFSVHGTGEDEAVRLLTQRLGILPFDRMEDAVMRAVEAAR